MKYTKQQLTFLKDGFKQMRVPELTEKFNQHFGLNKSLAAIKSTLKNHKFTCGRKGGHAKGVFLSYTEEQAEYIKTHYPLMETKKLVEEFNQRFGTERTAKQIKSFTSRHKIKSGRDGLFKKEHKPWNTGSKGVCKPNSGSFKKGGNPSNTKPIGSERLCSKNGYVLIKVDEPNPYTGTQGYYRPKHHVVWEQHHGTIPRGYVVSFINADQKNSDIENLMLLSRAQQIHLQRLEYYKAPDDLKPSLLALAKVEVKMFELTRKEV
ncbi:MAG: HNH endonuclease [Gammaproteobacteria bacterium]|nr:HNH endonuclease [Gammaproteobacteria bacterium]